MTPINKKPFIALAIGFAVVYIITSILLYLVSRTFSGYILILCDALAIITAFITLLVASTVYANDKSNKNPDGTIKCTQSQGQF